MRTWADEYVNSIVAEARKISKATGKNILIVLDELVASQMIALNELLDPKYLKKPDTKVNPIFSLKTREHIAWRMHQYERAKQQINGT